MKVVTVKIDEKQISRYGEIVYGCDGGIAEVSHWKIVGNNKNVPALEIVTVEN